MYTSMVEPSVAMVRGSGVSAHPKFVMTPETVSPCAGVSIVPKGTAALSLAKAMIFVSSSDDPRPRCELYAENANVPLPRPGNRLLRSM